MCTRSFKVMGFYLKWGGAGAYTLITFLFACLGLKTIVFTDPECRGGLCPSIAPFPFVSLLVYNQVYSFSVHTKKFYNQTKVNFVNHNYKII